MLYDITVDWKCEKIEANSEAEAIAAAVDYMAENVDQLENYLKATPSK